MRGGGERGGGRACRSWTSAYLPRAKISSELAKVINDGLFYYEHDLLAVDDDKVGGGGEGGGEGWGRARRTWTSAYLPRAKISSELAKVINDGLFYYEHDLLAVDDDKVGGGRG